MLGGTLAWIRQRIEPAPDPALESAVRWYATQVVTKIGELKASFRLKQLLDELQAPNGLDEAIVDRAFRLCLRRAWADGTVTVGESRALQDIASKLELPADRARHIELYTADVIFRGVFSRALADGHLDASEVAHLRSIAASGRSTLDQASRRFLREHGRSLIEEIILRAADEGTVSDARWQALSDIAQSIEMPLCEFLSELKSHAVELISDLSARVAADGIADEEELLVFHDLIDRFSLDATTRAMLERSVSRLTRKIDARDVSIHGLARKLNECGTNDFVQFHLSSVSASQSVAIASSRGATWWQLEGEANANRKYDAGASSLVSRKRLRVGSEPPRMLKSTIACCSLHVGAGAIYLLPNGLLVMGGGRFEGFHPSEIELATSRFVESEPLPSDATVVDYTWQYVNRDGGPDSRFRDNPKFPICEYGQILVPTRNWRMQTSNRSIPELLARL